MYYRGESHRDILVSKHDCTCIQNNLYKTKKTIINFRVDRKVLNEDDRSLMTMTMTMNDNDNKIDLFRHHNGNNTNIKVIFKQVTMLDKCNCI